MGVKRIEIVRPIDVIGRKLQAEMTFPGVRQYLAGFGVDVDRATSSVNSKWVFVKELLGPEPADRVLDIADDLDIAHGLRQGPAGAPIEAKFWLPGYLKLFLSHVSAVKEKTSKLQTALRRFGISAFVAHEDIEPTLEWQTEIEKALFSMDALAAVMSPGFHESNWTDQEVGVAIGRDVLIVALRVGLDPYGLIGKQQGVQAKGKTPGEVAELIFGILISHPGTTTMGFVGMLLLSTLRMVVWHRTAPSEWSLGSLLLVMHFRPEIQKKRASFALDSSGTLREDAHSRVRVGPHCEELGSRAEGRRFSDPKSRRTRDETKQALCDRVTRWHVGGGQLRR